MTIKEFTEWMNENGKPDKKVTLRIDSNDGWLDHEIEEDDIYTDCDGNLFVNIEINF